MTNANGEFSSEIGTPANLPQLYDNSANCSWIIAPSESFDQILLRFEDFGLASNDLILVSMLNATSQQWQLVREFREGALPSNASSMTIGGATQVRAAQTRIIKFCFCWMKIINTFLVYLLYIEKKGSNSINNERTNRCDWL